MSYRAVRAARENAGLAQGRVAAEIGVSRTWYNEFEQGYHDLGKDLGPADVLVAIERIVARLNAEQAS